MKAALEKEILNLISNIELYYDVHFDSIKCKKDEDGILDGFKINFVDEDFEGAPHRCRTYTFYRINQTNTVKPHTTGLHGVLSPCGDQPLTRATPLIRPSATFSLMEKGRSGD